MAKKKARETGIDIVQLEEGYVKVYLLGTSPIILNRMSRKAMEELLMPRGRKTAAEKASRPKHQPLSEFRASAYTDRSGTTPTYLQFLAGAFGAAMREAALDIPDVTKSKILRLVFAEGDVGVDRVSLYGIPQLLMSVVRSADINKTPDIRTRAIVPQWACEIGIRFRRPLLNQQGIANLIAAAGVSPGVGDWRPGKGGVYGRFAVSAPDDDRYRHVVETGGRDAQISAMENPTMYDDETADLYDWYWGEFARRGFDDLSDAPGTPVIVEALGTTREAISRKNGANGAVHA